MAENSEENQDFNHIYLCVNIQSQQTQRLIAASFINVNQRTIHVTEFLDNDHFSNFESLLLQTNPQSNSFIKFHLVLGMPDLDSEKEKINDILGLCDIQGVVKGRADFHYDSSSMEIMNFLLEKPMKQYVQESLMTQALGALTCVVNYCDLAADPSNKGQFKLLSYTLDQFMKLDLAALNALNIFPKAGTNEIYIGSLLEILDKTRTQSGGRLLRRWIKQPLRDLNEIIRRHDLVEAFMKNQGLRMSLQQDFLKRVPDTDRLCSKFYKLYSQKKSNATLNDCVKVYELIKSLEKANEAMKNESMNDEIITKNFVEPLRETLEDFEKLTDLCEKAIDMGNLMDGDYMIRPNFSKKLLEIHRQLETSKSTINDIRSQVESDLGGVEVKLVESGTYTFLFEVNKKQGDDAFRASNKKFKQVSVRNRIIAFTSGPLQEQVAEYCELMDSYKFEQKEVVNKILGVVATYFPALEKASELISELDVLSNFAHISSTAPTPYCKPKMTNGRQLILKDCRHPCLEIYDPCTCVSNDCIMDKNSSALHIITGPNMGGKSTFIRQVAICVLMAHIGCFVPSIEAEIPIIDAIITRVGASDMQMRGISTFMSEMLEASCMLKAATSNSLLIIDELGRGTSTSEGFGLAYAIAEHIAQEIKPYCLFATHFHEMTTLASQIPSVKNYYVAALISNGKLNMLYKVKPGAVDRSYGLYVAEMLNFPKEVLEDAKRKAFELEQYENFFAAGGMESNIDIEENDSENYLENMNEEMKELAINASLEKKVAIVDLYDEMKKEVDSCNEIDRKAILQIYKEKIMNELRRV